MKSSAGGPTPTSVAGTTCSRKTSSERFEAASVPLPLIDSDTIATVLSELISMPEGSDS
jgi:hypothetical protein